MKYELMVLLNPKQTEKELEKVLKEIKGILGENDFEIVDEDIWGMRDLAYTIAGNDRAYYAILNFTGEPAGMPAVQKDLRILPGLMRQLLIKVDDDYTLMRYEGGLMMAKSAGAKMSSPAEELNKKVRSSRKKTETKKDEAEATPEKTEELDEKLKAIIEDKDIL